METKESPAWKYIRKKITTETALISFGKKKRKRRKTTQGEKTNNIYEMHCDNATVM